MRRESSLKSAGCALLAVLIPFSLYGCGRQEAEVIRLGEWAQELCASTGIEQFEQKAPYFLNVTEENPCYPAVQALVEWGVIEPDAGFQPDAALTREWAAYTLINLAGETGDSGSSVLKDASQSRFPKQIERAAAFGLMPADERGKFHPKKIMEADAARQALARITEYINNRRMEEPHAEVDWNQDTEILDVEPLEFDAEQKTAVFATDTQILPGLYVRWQESDAEHLYRVESAVTESGRVRAMLQEADPFDLIDHMDVQDDFDVDFSKTEITDESDLNEGGAVPISYVQPAGHAWMSLRPLQHTHTYGQWTVSYQVTSSGIKAEVYQGSSEGGKAYASFRLSRVHPSFRWKMGKGNIEDGYFKVSYETAESLGIYRGRYKTLYGDFSRLSSSDFMESLKNLLQKKEDTANLTIPLCSIKVPLPNAPMFQITMRLQLRLYTTGRAEVSLVGQHVSGMEIRNNRFRPIQECSHSAQALVRADTSIVGSTRFGFQLNRLLLADIAAEAGARAKVKTIVHLFDENGKVNSRVSSAPADFADEMAEGNENVRVCADMKAYWVMNLIFNSPQSLAGRLNLAKRLELLNESNAPLIPGLNRHFENWQAVDRCTVTGRHYEDPAEHMPDTSRLRPAAYAMILDIGESRRIEYTAVPSGYTEKDLCYSSQDGSTASVSADGMVQAKKEGTTIITAATKDGLYQAKISILVRRVRGA